MTDEQIRESAPMKDFLSTWGKHCGAPWAVFSGHALVLARELLALQREVQELSASGFGHKLWISPFLGRFITLHVDPDVPDDEVHIRDHNGRLLGKITHVGHNT